MSTSEIAKLESRWRENPQGLTFAPLAEAYRKSREPERALEILRVGLERHPEYIPASIVLGRCHLDLGDDGAAEAAFLRVLDLDAENVIALKGLSDITERHSRFDEAERWLGTLLSIDRSNDEARAQLARVEAARSAPPEPAPSPDVADAGPEPVTGSIPELEPESELEPEMEPEFFAPATEPSAAGDPASESVDPAGPAVAPLALDESWDSPMEALEADRDGEAAVVDPAEVTGGGDADPAPWSTPAPVEDDIVVEDARDGFDVIREDATLDGLEQQEFAPPTEAVEPVLDVEREERSFDAGSSADAGLAEVEQHDEIELRPSGTSEYQLGSGGDDWATTLQPAADSSEFQVPSAAEEFGPPDSGVTAADAEHATSDPAPLEALTAYSRDSWSLPSDELDGAAALSADDEALAAAFAASADVAGGEDAAADEPEPPAMENTPVAGLEPVEPEGYDGDDDEEAASAGTDMETDLVVTESMAELYLRQGHRMEALRVYRELYRRSPDDLRLRETVDALEVEEAEAEAVNARPSAAADTPATRPAYAAADSARSVGALLGSILAARPAGVARADWPSGSGAAPKTGAVDDAAPEPAAPTRPASDHLSLSSVFGDDGSPVPPAVPAAAGDARSHGLSFDDFFEDEAAGEASATKGRATPPRQEEDLDQFHAWLQNLKR